MQKFVMKKKYQNLKLRQGLYILLTFPFALGSNMAEPCIVLDPVSI